MPVILAWLAPYLFRIIIGAVVVAALGGAWLAFAKHYEHKERDKIIMQDQGAVNNAKSELKNVDDCYAAGGTFDTVRWMCDH